MTAPAAAYDLLGAMPPDVVERAVAGEPEAVAAIYDEHHQTVRAFSRRLVGDEQAAEDLVHDVFVSLPDTLRRYAGRSSLRTFLIGVAVNHARHHVRAASRRRAAVRRLSLVSTAAPPEDPEVAATRRELAEALTRALDALPLRQRVVFVLCEVEERTSAEVARIIDAPEGTVRSRLHHAKRKLRAALAREGYR